MRNSADPTRAGCIAEFNDGLPASVVDPFGQRRRTLLAAGAVLAASGLCTPLRAAMAAAQVTSTSVGYREFRLEATLPGATASTGQRPRRLLFWYPGIEPDTHFTYTGGQAGRAARDAKAAPGRHPVILFSHGFMGAADQSVFITETLARLGYIVVAPDHADAPGRSQQIEVPDFLNPRLWTDATQANRRQDLSATLDHLIRLDADPAAFLHGRVDRQRIGALGHSLGGYAVLGLAGARRAWHDPRVGAVAALSPYIAPYLEPSAFTPPGVPVLLQGGSYDIGITPLLPAFYSLLDVPKYFLVLRATHHLGWTDLAYRGREIAALVRTGNPHWIVVYTVAFFDQHLRGLPRSHLLARANEALESFTFNAGAAGRR